MLEHMAHEGSSEEHETGWAGESEFMKGSVCSAKIGRCCSMGNKEPLKEPKLGMVSGSNMHAVSIRQEQGHGWNSK